MRAWTAFALILGLAVLSGCGSGTSATPAGTAPAGNPSATGVEVVVPVRIVLEAESPTAMEAVHEPTKREFLKVREQTEGKLVRFLEIEDKLIEKCGLEKEKDKVAALPGKASYEFEAPRDDTYYVFLRAKWYDSCGNSVWVRMDDSSYLNLEDENGKNEKTFNWAWHALMLEGRPKGFKLTKGKHTLHMAVREDGPWLDQWLIATEATMPAGPAPLK